MGNHRTASFRSAAFLTVFALVASVLGLTSFTPFKAADAAAPVTIAGATFSTSIIQDGTGHGTTSACYINSANGFTGPVDNGPTDGVVCSQDTLVFGINYSLPAATSPLTTYRITVPLNGNIVSRDPAQANFCTNDVDNKYTAVKVSDTTTGVTCDITPISSGGVSGQWTIPQVIKENPSSTVYSPSVSVTAGGNTVAVPTDSFTIAVGVIYDALSSLISLTPSVVTQSGTTYLKYTLNLGLSGSFTWPNSSYSTTKGNSRYIQSGQVTANLSSLPAGSLITNPSAGMTISGNTVTYATVNNPTVLGITSSSTKRPSVSGTVDILIPQPTVLSVWNIPITSSSVVPFTPSSYVNAPFQSLGQPGANQPSTYDTAGWNGRNFQYIYSGQTAANNDWTILTYNPSIPSNGLVSKDLYRDNNGAPGVGTVNSGLLRADTVFWANYTVTSYPATASRFAICDTWNVDTATDALTGPKIIDTSKSVIVQAADGAGVLQPITTGFTLLYSTSANACSGDASAAGDSTWTTTPSVNTRAIKVVFTPNVDLSSSSNVKFKVFVPFKTRSASYYPNLALGNNTFVYDYLNVAYSSPGQTPTWSPTINRYTLVGPISASAITYDEIQTIGSYATSPGPSSLSTGSTYGYGYYHLFSLSNTLPSDTLTGKFTITSTISSCALNVGPTPWLSSASEFPNVTHTVTPPNYGPDGIPCTSDDVSGWVITTKGDFVTNDATKSFAINVKDIVFTVAPWAKSTDSISTRSVITIDPDWTTTNYTGQSTDSAPIVVNATTGQYKSTTQSREQVGDDISWDSVFFNSRTTAVTGVEFIDILPYNGDANGSVLKAPLSNIRLTATNLPAGAKLMVTRANPTTLSSDTQNAANAPTNTALWCEYGTAACLPGGAYTAYYLYMPTMAAGLVTQVHVDAGTAGTANLDKAVNRLGTGYIAGSGTPVLPSTPVTIDLYLNSISGNVYNDWNKSYTKDAAENTLPNMTVRLYNGTTNALIATTTTDASGNYTFPNLVNGSYYTRLGYTTLPAPWESVTQAGTNQNVFNSQTLTLNDSVITDVNFGLFDSPTIAVTKTVDKANAKVGDTLTYTITVTNPGGGAPLTPTLTDTKCTGMTRLSGDTNSNNKIDTNETWTYRCTYVVVVGAADQYGNYVNTVDVVGDDGVPATTNPTATASAITKIITPGITIKKYINGDDAETSPGVPLNSANMTVRLVITNSGDTPLTSVNISDNVIASTAFSCRLLPSGTWANTLQPGQQAECTATVAAPTGSTIHRNIATATGTTVVGNVTATDQAYAYRPSLTVTKTVDKANAKVGDVLNYTITATTTYATPQSVTFTDPKCDTLSARTGDTNGDNMIVAGETWRWTCRHVVTTADMASSTYVNTATVALSDGNATTPDLTQSGSATTNLYTPAITVVKKINGNDANTSPGQAVAVGSTMNITFEVTNNGTVPITALTLTDTDIATSNIICPSVLPLNPGGTMTCVASLAAPTGTTIHQNTATVTGTTIVGTITATDDAFAYAPTLTVTKTVDKANAKQGDTLNYTITATTTYATPQSVTFTDPKCDTLSARTGDTNGDNMIVAGETWRWTCRHIVTGADMASSTYVNTATVALSDGNATTPDLTQSGSATTNLYTPGIQVVKKINGNDANTSPGQAVAAGSTMNITFEVTNTGNIPITSYTVTDTDVATANISCPTAAPIAPGATVTCSATLAAPTGATIHQNTATATGVTTVGNVSDTDDAFAYVPTLTVNKTVDKANAKLGDTLNYTITATTTYATPQIVVFTDPKCDTLSSVTGDTNLDNRISAGETWRWTCRHIVTSADMASSTYVNTATVALSDGDSTTPDLTQSSSATTNLYTPGVQIVKRINGDDANTTPGVAVAAGSAMSITFEVTNTGNTPLTSFSVTDTDIPTANITCAGAVPVAPGAKVYCSATLTAPTAPTVHQNTATVTAVTAVGTVSDTDDAFAYVPTLTVTKTVDKANASIGQTLNYTITATTTYTIAQNVTFTDAKCTGLAGPTGDTNGDGKIIAGETWRWTCSHAVVVADFASSTYTNTATVALADGVSTTPDLSQSSTATTNLINSAINVKVCLNTSDCAVPISGNDVSWNGTATTTNASGSTLYNYLTPSTNGAFSVTVPAWAEVKEVLVDGVSVGTTIPANVASPASGVKNIVVVYAVKSVNGGTDSPKMPVFESGM